MRGRFLITPHAAAVKRAAPGRYIESPMPCRVPLFHGGGSLIREARFDSAHACADFLGFFWQFRTLQSIYLPVPRSAEVRIAGLHSLFTVCTYVFNQK